MKREFMREYENEEELPVREKVRIGVIGLNGGNGCTFVATSLACELARRRKYSVAFAELREGMKNKPLVYDAMAMNQRFKNRRFEEFYSVLKESGIIRNLFNLEERVNWALMTPEENSKGLYLNLVEKLRLINNIAGDIVVVDFSDYGDRGELEILISEMDKLLIVVDPMPAKLISAKDFMDFFKQHQLKADVVWVINKCNDGTHKRKLRDYVKLKNPVQIPAVKTDHFYAAQFNCRPAYMQKEIRKQTEKSIAQLADACLP